MKQAHTEQRRIPTLPGMPKAAVAAGEALPVQLTPDEIKALLNTWPNKPTHKIIPHKPHKWEKRVLLPIEADWDLDDVTFDPEAKPREDALQFINASGGARVLEMPYGVGTRLYVDELVEVVDRPDGSDWVRIRYMADDERRQILFNEGEARPKLGLLRYKHLPERFARSDRLSIQSVRIQRLWDVTEAEAEAEGAPMINHRRGTYFPSGSRRMGFEANWNQLHAPLHGFEKGNWWVAVLSFARDFDE